MPIPGEPHGWPPDATVARVYRRDALNGEYHLVHEVPLETVLPTNVVDDGSDCFPMPQVFVAPDGTIVEDELYQASDANDSRT